MRSPRPLTAAFGSKDEQDENRGGLGRRTGEPTVKIDIDTLTEAELIDLNNRIVERLRFSNREAEMICQIVRHHLRPGLLSREPQLTRRAIFRFYKDLGDCGPACLLTWWNDRMATRGPASRLDQLDQQRSRLEELLMPYFFKAQEVVRPPRLVDGYGLMRALGLSPGPLVGSLLDAIEEAQAEGLVSSADEAINFAKRNLSTWKSKKSE